MTQPIQRYWRAFITALRMTARGEVLTAPPPAPLQPTSTYDETLAQAFPNLYAWMRETLRLIDGVYAAAAREKVALPKVILTIDRREISAQTILDAVRFHAAVEYPALLRDPVAYQQLAIRAQNVNDHYMAVRLAEVLTTAATVAAVAALGEHLGQFPATEWIKNEDNLDAQGGL